MAKTSYKIVWTDEAKLDLKNIFNFIKRKSLQGAKNVMNDILNSPKSVHFYRQNESELYNLQYLRIIVRNYKVLYKIIEVDKELVIHAVYDTRQSPDKLMNKNILNI